MSYAIFFAILAGLFAFLWVRSDSHRSDFDEFLSCIASDLEKARTKPDVRKVIEAIKHRLNG